jgi:hypothetical protein
MSSTKRKSNENWHGFRNAICLLVILCTAFCALFRGGHTFAANPAAGSIAPTGPVGPFTGAWAGTLTGSPPAGDGEPTCVITQAGTIGNCDNFTLTVTGTQASWIGKRIRVKFTWTSPSTDYDMVIRRESNSIAGLQGDGLCTSQPGDCPEPFDEFAGSSGSGASTSEEAVLSPSESGVGAYYVRAIYFAASAGDQYQATVSVFDAPISSGGAPVVPPTFDNFQPSDPAYPRRDDSAEPSIGVNWNTGNVMTMSRLQCNRTTFNDATSPADPVDGAIWFHQAPKVIVTGLDPILFTDSITGRTICGELQSAGGATNGVLSDDDLTTAVQTFQTGGPTQGVDHQSIAGGPPKPGITGRQPTGSYPHLFYYASQQTAYASVATSLDGGITYLPAVPAYTLAQCTNLHGHLKVGPDGTVYLPNRSCGGHAAVIVSDDNGLNWSIRPVPTSSAGGSDPSVGIGLGGRIYIGYMNGSERPHVAVSSDHGVTWNIDVDIAALVPGGVRAAVFPQVVAGDNDRAAIFFLATNSTDPLDPVGDDNGGAGPNFKGTWYPYIAMTVDGGITWTVVRADNDPLHPGVLNPAQQGVVCLNGTVCPGPPTVPVDTRNLADFNEISVDSAGRVLAVYADGCNFDHACININNNTADRTGNQGVARITIIRQRGGSRLFSEFDAGSPGAPSSPFVDVTAASGKAGTKVTGNSLLWGTPDNHASQISKYRIYRGKPGAGEKLLATVRYGTNTFVDRKGKRGDYYHVTAINKYGESRKIAKSFARGG